MESVAYNDNKIIRLLTDPRKRRFRSVILLVVVAVLAISIVWRKTPDVVYHPVVFLVCVMTLFFVFMCLFYINNDVLVPRLLLQHRYAAYSFSCLALATALLVFEISMEYTLIHICGYSIGYCFFLGDNRYPFISILSELFIYLITILGTSFPVLFKHWRNEGRKVFELEKTTLQSELGKLKNKISPQFLFRTLDKAAASTGKPELVSLILIKVSKLLRYQLYDSSGEKTLLSADISFLSDFLELKKTCRPNFSYALSEEGDVRRILAPPLLFFPCYTTMPVR